MSTILHVYDDPSRWYLNPRWLHTVTVFKGPAEEVLHIIFPF
jgi:hypothetical protein